MSLSKLDRLADSLGDLLAKVEARADLPDLSKYRDDILGFCDEVLGVSLLSKQKEIALAVQDQRRVIAFGAQACGKDHVAGCIAAWWIFARGGRVIYQSAKLDQVVQVCFADNLVRRIREAGLGAECYTQSVRRGTETVALGMTSASANRLSGFHFEGGVLAILSEGQGIEEAGWLGAFAVCTSEADRILSIGNPVAPGGLFWRVSRDPEWVSVQVGVKDHPNIALGLKPGDENYIAGGPSAGWAEEMARIWGRNSPHFRARVEGWFPTESMHGLCRRSWLDRSAAAWASGDLRDDTAESVLAADIARYGPDASCVAIRQGPVLLALRAWYGTSITETAERIAEIAKEFGMSPRQLDRRGREFPSSGRLKIDECGLGAGCVDILKKAGWTVEGFNGARKASESGRFANKRAESYWRLARLLEEGKVALPPDEDLFAEMTALEYGQDGQGRVSSKARTSCPAGSAEVPTDPTRFRCVSMATTAARGCSRSDCEEESMDETLDRKVRRLHTLMRGVGLRCGSTGFATKAQSMTASGQSGSSTTSTGTGARSPVIGSCRSGRRSCLPPVGRNSRRDSGSTI